MMQLLAVACLSLAAKMEETEVPLSVDLQVRILHNLLFASHVQVSVLSSDSDYHDVYRLVNQNLYLKQELSKEWSFLCSEP